MSSLLDILHRKDSRAERDAEPADPAADSTAQTVDVPIELPVELRLAVDNGPLESVDEISAEEPAVAPSPAATPATDPFATRLLTAAQLQQRSRRSSVWLGAGLALIVLAAGVATWLLNEIKVNPAGNDSLFTAPGPDSSSPPVAASVPVERATPESNAQEGAMLPKAPKRPKLERTDTAWFDTPATEAPAGVANEMPVEPSADSSAEPIRIVRGSTANPLFPKLQEAWIAFQAADYLRAESLYREVRAVDAGNVDALLGLGALAARGNRTAEAREMYQAVLLAEPKNATALSALSTLPVAGTSQLDESALKNLLREQPNAANLHFALGLQYVADGRWPDAQIAFFDAVRNEPTNADYAYNLAVSLDRLGQAGPAAAYYQRALNLATASALFNPGIAQARLNTLRPAAPPATAQ